MTHHVRLTTLAFCGIFAGALSFSTVYAQDTTSGLVFYLPFDGSLAEKVTGLDPENSPGITRVAGRFGGGITADGNLSGLEYPIQIPASTWPEGSVAAWIKISHKSPSTTTVFASNWNSQLTIVAGKVESQLGANASYQTASAFQNDVWTHVASTWRKSGDQVNMSFYVNGKKMITETRAYRTAGDFPKTYVGAWAGAFAQSLIGDLDEVVFYDRRLSDNGVAALHRGPAQGQVSAPVGVRDPSVLAPTQASRPGQLSVPKDGRTALPTVPHNQRNDELPVDEIRRVPGVDTMIDTDKLPGDQFDPDKLPGDQFDPTELPGDQLDPAKLPGDQFDRAKLPGDQFEPTKLPGDQFDIKRLPAEQMEVTPPRSGEAAEDETPAEPLEPMSAEESIRAGTEKLFGGKKKPEWEFLYVNRLGATRDEYVSDGENLTLQVAMKKTGPDSPAPVRILVRDANPNAPTWNGGNPGTKYDIDGSPGEVLVREVLVNYHRRFEEGDEAYSFIVSLTNPDGSPFVDSNMDNHEKLMVFYHTENKRKKADAEAEQARRDANKGYERRVRRSEVAGRTGDRVWRQVGKKGTILVGIKENSCGLKAEYKYLGAPQGEKYFDGLRSTSTQACKPNNNSEKSILKNERGGNAVFGLRLYTANNKFGYDKNNLKDLKGIELWLRNIEGSVLGQNLMRKKQFSFGEGTNNSVWRPWSYCPKESSGQRMVAVGFETHIQEQTHHAMITGIRLICEPLSQALDAREGPVMYFDINKNKWVEA